MNRGQRYRMTAEWRPRSLAVAVGPGLDVEILPAEGVSHTYLDTFDWRVKGAGGTLILETAEGSDRLVWIDDRVGSRPYHAPSLGVPRFADDLPRGMLRNRLESALDVRALLAVGATRLRRRFMRILDSDGNSVVRLSWEVVDIVPSGAGMETFHALRVEALPGQDEALGHVMAAVSNAVLDTLPATDLDVAAAAVGRSPGDYSSKLRVVLHPGAAPDAALRTILLELLHTLSMNVEGVRADHDREFLHDFRVACRRTRSALTQLRGVLDDDEVAPFLEHFKWLGSVTGPCRDLDVNLLEMDAFRALLPAAPARALLPMEERLQHDRAAAHREVVGVLDSARFRALLQDWEAFLHAGASDDEAAGAGTVDALARCRILRAYRRMVKRGAKLAPDPPAASLHRLRIDSKKLRYLLEFFRSLYPRERMNRLVKELKQLQDILGGFNDAEVQQRHVRELAQGSGEGTSLPVNTLLAMGRLEGALAQRQEEYRRAFHDRFETFADRSSGAEYEALFAGEV